MDLLQFLKLLIRQWVVVVVTLIATGAAAFVLSGIVEPEYRAQGSLVLLASTRPEGGDRAVNPWTRFGTSQQVAAQALLSVMHSEAFGRRAEAAGITDEFEVLISPTGGGAIIDLSVTGQGATAVVDQLGLLRDALQAELAGLQQRSGAPRESWFTADVLSFPVEATVLTGSKTRVIAAIGLLGAAVAVALALLSDRRGAVPRKLGRDERYGDATMTATLPPASTAVARAEAGPAGRPGVARPAERPGVARPAAPPKGRVARTPPPPIDADTVAPKPTGREAPDPEFIAAATAASREGPARRSVAHHTSVDAASAPRVAGAHPYVVTHRHGGDGAVDAVDVPAEPDEAADDSMGRDTQQDPSTLQT